MLNDIKDKLRSNLEKEIADECQVVYILSRMRKLIEIDGTRNKYKVLNIYCNWSLHSRIDRTEEVKDILDEFVSKKEKRHILLFFTHFIDEFNKFTTNELGITKDERYIGRFVAILREIISDTPIKLKKVKITTITINPSSLPRNIDEITYMITEQPER